MFYVYLLYSEKHDKYYVGYTDDPERRLLEHNEISEKSYTSKYRPWQMVRKFAVADDRGLAMKIEKHIKKQKSKEYIKNIVKRDNIDNLLKRFSLVD